MLMSNVDVSQIDIVVDVDDKASSKLNKINSVLQKVSNSVGKSENLATKTDRITTSVVKGLSKVYAVLDKITDSLSECFEVSNDYIETLNLSTVSFGKNSDAVNKNAKQIERLMGIYSGDWIDKQSKFNNVLTGFGVDSDISSEMSQQLTQLSYDFASVFNTDAEVAFQKLKSGMTGQIKGLKDFGFNLSVAQLKETALAHGIELSTAKMTEQQKAMLRYIYLMENSIRYQNDMARTLITPANSMRILNNQVLLLKQSMGNLVSVIAVKFIPYIQSFVNMTKRLVDTIALSLGFNPDDYMVGDDKIKEASFDLSDLGDNADDAEKSVKKLKKSLMGFDELNVLQDKVDNSTVLGGGLPGDLGLWDYAKTLGYDFTEGLTNFDTSEYERKLAILGGISGLALVGLGIILLCIGGPKTKALGIGMIVAGIAITAIALQNADFKKTVMGVLDTIGRYIKGVAMLALGIILIVVAGTNPATLPIAIAFIIAGATNIAAQAISDSNISDTVKATIASIATVVGMAVTVIGAILVFTGVAIPLGVAMLVAGLMMVYAASIIDDTAMQNTMQTIIDNIYGIVGGAMLVMGFILLLSPASVGLSIALIAIGAGLLVAEVATKWDSMSKDIKKVVAGITAIVSVAFLALGAILVASGVNLPLGIGLIVIGAATLVASAVMAWNTMSDKTKQTIQTILMVVAPALLVLGIILVATGVALPLGIALIAAGVLSLVAAVAINWDTFKTKVKNVISAILSIISGASIAIGIILCLTGAGIGLGIAMIMLGLKGVAKADEVSSNPVTKWIKSICNGAIDLVEKAVNKCIKLINKFGFSWDVPDWLQSVVGFSRLEVGANLSEVSIPRLATGGIDIPNGQIFQARESGPELVGTIGNKSAVVNNDQIVESVEGGVFRGVMAALQNSHNGNGNGRTVIEAHFYLDGQEITDNVIEHHNDYVKANGSSPLLIGG